MTKYKVKCFDENYQNTNTKVEPKRRKTDRHEKIKKVEVPLEFIEHILTLGFDKNDAPRLYDQKDDWMSIHTGGQLFCTKYGCQFYTKVNSDALFEHCRKEHGWKDYPCGYDNCSFVAYSSLALHHHGRKRVSNFTPKKYIL